MVLLESSSIVVEIVAVRLGPRTLRVRYLRGSLVFPAVTTNGQTSQHYCRQPRFTSLNCWSHLTSYLSLISSLLSRPLIYCERAGPSGACSQTRRPDIALVRAARLPGPTRRALSGMLA
jgi:hypothetical protein